MINPGVNDWRRNAGSRAGVVKCYEGIPSRSNGTPRVCIHCKVTTLKTLTHNSASLFIQPHHTAAAFRGPTVSTEQPNDGVACTPVYKGERIRSGKPLTGDC